MPSNATLAAGSNSIAEARPALGPSALGFTLWFTGLSGAGKTTLAQAVALELQSRNLPVAVLDGDVLRQTLCAGLGYSREDRCENIRRLSEFAAGIAAEGKIVLIAAIAPYREARAAARQRLGRFLEIYVNTPLAVCIQRDPKGLYARAISGQLTHFTGVDDPYEEPLTPEVECRTDLHPVSTCAATVLAALAQAAQNHS